MNGDTIRLAIFASGGGSNTDVICHYFREHPVIKVSLIVCNKKNAGVLNIAEKYHVPSTYVPHSQWTECDQVIKLLKNHHIDFIILAGFLKLIPESLISHWPDKIINIHPSLLPKYGGKGMYGAFVHQAVRLSGDSMTGMTVHLVNREYDKGTILFQASCPVDSSMTPEEIGQCVLKLEHKYFSRAIENYVLSQKKDYNKN